MADKKEVAGSQMTRLETLQQALAQALGVDLALSASRDDFSLSASRAGLAESELILDVPVHAWTATCARLRDDARLRFSLCLDLCGVDYSAYGTGRDAALGQPRQWPARYAVVLQLLSLEHNWRLRVRTWAADDNFPVLDSLLAVWPSVNWYEREAFDLYGIVFEGHPDLRRILTDYGFIGHPFRKDFPLSGNVEMRYDPSEQRVVYQPVSIAPREITPRVIREDGYGAGR